MDKDERKVLLQDVGDVVADKLKSHHADNGFVSKGTYDASTKVITQTLGRVGEAVTEVHKKMDEQTKVTTALGEITGKLSTDLIVHTAEHAGEEKAKKKLAAEESVKASKWKKYRAIVALIVMLLGGLGTFGVWAIAEVKAALEVKHAPRFVIDKETVKEIAKVVNGKHSEGDKDDL